MITTANGSNTPTTSTIVTFAKIQPRGRIPRQLRIGRTAHLARHIRHDVLSKQTLNILGNVLPANHQTLVTINTPLRSQLGHKKLKHVLGRTLHHRTNLLKVDPKSLLRPHAGELGRLHGTTLLLNEIGVLRVQDAHDAVEHVFVGVLRLAVVGVGVLAVGVLELGDEEALGGEAGVIVARGGGSGGRSLFFFLILLFLFLLLFGEVKHFC
mmetsp:Transcript_8421/g.12671  ORF Transcript_8421/g.12671 Transcript_8421/m.12671 type:complete len:211 (+) Transcript_8421:252-884(+)